MKKSMFKKMLLPIMLLGVLASCGGNNKNTDNGGDSDGGTTKTDLSAIVDDLVLDSDNNVTFEEQIDLNVWCIIGDPDKVKFEELVRNFNNEYMGQIHLTMNYQGHFDYYNALETTWQSDFEESFPDVCIMHNEKTAQYASLGYLYPLTDMNEKTKINMDYSSLYSNIDRVSFYKENRYAVPMDAHGFVTSIRQDIIKKNNLGFDNNTRYIPESREEYQTLLENLRKKADSSEGLLVRSLLKGQDHSWKKVDKNSFYPEFFQSTDPDGLSALYANNGALTNSDESKITFQENDGFMTYIYDQVDRYNAGLMGVTDSNAASFASGNVVMFSEGPWYVAQTYTLSYNNSDFTLGSKKETDFPTSLGVTYEEATDPVYSKPYIASRPTGWRTLDENENTENGSKWYGNGHSISLTKHIKSATKAAAAMTFINWITQGKDSESGEYNLADWCTAGHVPAWKNVYESNEYKSNLENNMTLRALGDPANIIAMDPLAYEVTIFDTLATCVSNVQSQLKTSEGCTKDKAKEIVDKAISDGQSALDLLRLTRGI